MRKKIILIILLLSFFVSLVSLPRRVFANSASVYIDPERTTGLDVGDTVLIDVAVSNVTDLKSWEFKLYYKSSVLNASNMFHDNTCILKQHPNASAQFFYMVHIWNDTYDPAQGLGLIQVAALVYDVPDGVTGSGRLVWIEFKAKGSGDSPLNLTEAFPDTPILRDSKHQPIPHTTIDGIVHVGLRDVAVTDIQAPGNVASGTIARINVTAENQGEMTQTFDVTLFYDDTAIETKPLLNMLGGAITILNFTWDTTPIPIGEYVIRAEATTVPGEVDTADNTHIYGTIYIGIRDIAITNTNPSKTCTNDTIVTITVTVRNNGEVTQTFDVTVYYNITVIDTQTATNLTAGTQTTLTFTWNTTTIPKGKYRISTMATTVPGETNTVDNTYTDGWVTETILGDLDGDYEVKIKDIAIVARAFGSKPGDPNWEPNADINNDGEIKIYDVATVARQFGKTAL